MHNRKFTRSNNNSQNHDMSSTCVYFRDLKTTYTRQYFISRKKEETRLVAKIVPFTSRESFLSLHKLVTKEYIHSLGRLGKGKTKASRHLILLNDQYLKKKQNKAIHHKFQSLVMPNSMDQLRHRRKVNISQTAIS